MLDTDQYLVDTSIWIDYFRHGKGEIFDTLERLLTENKIVMCGPVETEILSGIRSNERRKINEIFNILPFINIEREDFRLAGNLLNDLRQKGIKIPPTDSLIGAIAIRRNLTLITNDKHFNHLKS